jgi:hypothetical protein
MIKYNTVLGLRHLNAEARMQKEMMQSRLKGLRCSKCLANTIISFKENQTPINSGLGVVKYIVPVADACCNEFKTRIMEKLGQKV